MIFIQWGFRDNDIYSRRFLVYYKGKRLGTRRGYDNPNWSDNHQLSQLGYTTNKYCNNSFILRIEL
jgi:hypothetical protein